MELKRWIRVRVYIYIFFFTYFLANNSKILFLSFHIDSSFSSIRVRGKGPGFGKVSSKLERLGDPTAGQRSKVGAAERSQFSGGGTFSYHFPCVLLSCVHRLGVVDPAQPEADCGHSKRQRERDWRRREPTVEQRPLCRSSTVLSPPRPTLHAPLLPSSPRPPRRARARVRVHRVRRVYTLKHHSGRQLKLARE